MILCPGSTTTTTRREYFLLTSSLITSAQRPRISLRAELSTFEAVDGGYVYYKAGLAGQWPFLRVFSAIGRKMAKQRWPMAERAKCEDPRLFTLALEPRR